jgi:hypothetical protein
VLFKLVSPRVVDTLRVLAPRSAYPRVPLATESSDFRKSIDSVRDGTLGFPEATERASGKEESNEPQRRAPDE